MNEQALAWHGNLHARSIKLPPAADLLKDISLKAPPSTWLPPLPKCDLDLLTYINPSLVPLHLILGPSLHVGTSDDETQAWFSSVLMDELPLRGDARTAHTVWDDTPLLQSRVGVLARPRVAASFKAGEPRVTEVLFFAERSHPLRPGRLPTPPTSSQGPDESSDAEEGDEREGEDQISVRALFISSDLQSISTPTKPLQEGVDHDAESHFLPAAFSRPQSSAERSKKRLGNMFDAAVEQRKRARHSHAQSISLAAARTGSFERAIAQDEGQEGGDRDGVRVLQGRRPARLGSSRTAVSAGHARKTSVASSAAASGGGATGLPPITPGLSTFEQRNKESVSRIVMAGMRIYGLQASKRSKALSAGVSAVVGGHEEPDADADAEFKGVYHQTYKGTLFKFRREIGSAVLVPERVRDVVDRLLAVFCEPP